RALRRKVGPPAGRRLHVRRPDRAGGRAGQEAGDEEVTMPKLLHCVVVTPEATALEQDAEFVALPLYDGEIGIAPAHSPMIGRLGYGEMRIRSAGGRIATYYLDGGFVQVTDNVVSVRANRAVPAARGGED